MLASRNLISILNVLNFKFDIHTSIFSYIQYLPIILLNHSLKVINDLEHSTIVSASTQSLKIEKGNDKEAADAVGKALGELAKVP